MNRKDNFFLHDSSLNGICLYLKQKNAWVHCWKELNNFWSCSCMPFKNHKNTFILGNPVLIFSASFLSFSLDIDGDLFVGSLRSCRLGNSCDWSRFLELSCLLLSCESFVEPEVIFSLLPSWCLSSLEGDLLFFRELLDLSLDFCLFISCDRDLS